MWDGARLLCCSYLHQRLSRLLAITPFPEEALLLCARTWIPDAAPHLPHQRHQALKLGQDVGHCQPCLPGALAQPRSSLSLHICEPVCVCEPAGAESKGGTPPRAAGGVTTHPGPPRPRLWWESRGPPAFSFTSSFFPSTGTGAPS